MTQNSERLEETLGLPLLLRPRTAGLVALNLGLSTEFAVWYSHRLAGNAPLWTEYEAISLGLGAILTLYGGAMCYTHYRIGKLVTATKENKP